MEYFFIACFISVCFIIVWKFPYLKQKPSLVIPLFFILIFSNTVFVHFTVWKFIAFLVIIGTSIHAYVKSARLKKIDDENK